MTGGVGMHLPRLRKRGDGVSPLRGHNGHICSICFRRPLSLLALFGHHFILGYSDGFIAFAVFANNTGCLHSLMHKLEQFFSGGVLDDKVVSGQRAPKIRNLSFRFIVDYLLVN